MTILRMRSVVAVIAACALFAGSDAGQTSPATRTTVVPLFSDFPVRNTYTGPAANPEFKSASGSENIEAVLQSTSLSPNFAGQFRIVQFRIRKGPIGAVLVDSKTGSLFRLPYEIVKRGFFIDRTDCLAGLGQWAKLGDEDNPTAPLAFKLSSELLEVKQCGTAVERNYYRWHGRKWYFLKRLASPPPPAP
jgi:hypothetical protein